MTYAGNCYAQHWDPDQVHKIFICSPPILRLERSKVSAGICLALGAAWVVSSGGGEMTYPGPLAGVKYQVFLLIGRGMHKTMMLLRSLETRSVPKLPRMRFGVSHRDLGGHGDARLEALHLERSQGDSMSLITWG